VVSLLCLFCCWASGFISLEQELLQFQQFQRQFNRSYSTPQEAALRFNNFVTNLAKAKVLNEKFPSAQWGVTMFSDMSQEEFKSKMLMSHFPKIDKDKYPVLPRNQTVNIPYSFDWRNRGGTVTGVYNQGRCGSCWAFSAIETLESSAVLSGGQQLFSLSPQQLVDCDHISSKGCAGGTPIYAFEYVQKAGGIEQWSSYPYAGVDQNCRFNGRQAVVHVHSFGWVVQNRNEQQIAEFLVAHGPISVCVEADQWMNYHGGIVPGNACGRNIDHCVVLTGYNTGPPAYWNVRNSWGTGFGEGGYIRLQAFQDTCGLAEYPSWASCG